MTKILVIDDNPVARSTISTVLESDGYEIVAAADGVRGLAVFEREQPDLVITDIIMPETEECGRRICIGTQVLIVVPRDKWPSS